MGFVVAIPLAVRLVVLFIVGTFAGGMVNWAVYRLAYHARSISPWSAPAADAPRRRATDRVPVVGWFGLRRESRLHERGFWIRPLVVELLTGAMFAGLYLCETHAPLRVAAPGWAPAPSAEFLTADLALADHVRYLSHAILICFMLAASLIDLDEQLIPDSITVLGTLVALFTAAAYPWSLLPAGYHVIDGQPRVEFLTLASPRAWPSELNALPATLGLAVAAGCWTLWCGGLLPRYWKTRRGWNVAVRIFFHRLRVEQLSYFIFALWVAGMAAIALAAWRAGAAHWAALVTALVGMAVGGGIIWAVRVIAGGVLQKEAMGFGDVTLMSMIGALVGWQACLLVFFAAPFFALGFAIANWVLHRERMIPYGPFLCLGAGAVILRWPPLWDRVVDFFAPPWLVPAVIVCCLVMLGFLLAVYRVILGLLMRSG